MNPVVVDVFLLYLRLGLMSFGGAQVTIAEMQRETVARGWLTDGQFLEAFAIGQLSPGPGALYIVPIGYKAAGFAGALAAVAGYMLPTALVAFIAVLLWGRVRTSHWPAAIRDALVPVTLGLLFASTLTMGRVVLADRVSLGIALASAAILWRTKIPTPIVLLAAGALGTALLSQPWI